LNKTIKVSIVVALIFAIGSIGFANATPRVMKECNMVYWTSDDSTLNGVAGNQVSGFKLKLDGNPNTWYYLDMKFIKPALPAGVYQFWIEPPTNPDFWTYWDAKGVHTAPTDYQWQTIMYHIIYRMGYYPSGIPMQSPMFSLRTDGDGNYMLVDGLLWYISGFTARSHLQLNGDYPLGTYTFKCYGATEYVLTGIGPSLMPNVLDDFTITITFR